MFIKELYPLEINDKFMHPFLTRRVPVPIDATSVLAPMLASSDPASVVELVNSACIPDPVSESSYSRTIAEPLDNASDPAPMHQSFIPDGDNRRSRVVFETTATT